MTIDLDLARRVRDAGHPWQPAKGDRFLVPDRDFDDVEFVLSDMVVEVRRVGDGGQVLAFNGTTEWALDSLEIEEAVWLPREDQLRDLLGASFERLERITEPLPAYVVHAAGRPYAGATAEEAYARAVLRR